MRFLTGILVIGLLAMTPSVARADIFTPNPADLGDLDHANAYAWKINAGALQAGAQEGHSLSATLSFQNIRNWNTSANELFIHLFDKMLGPTGGSWVTNGGNVYSFVDNATSNVISDVYGATATTPTWLVGNSFLTQLSFAGTGQAPDKSSDGDDPNNPGELMIYSDNGTPLDPTDDYWTYNDPTGGPATGGSSGANAASNGGVWKATYGDRVNGVQYYDYTYTFSAGELAKLGQYIANDGWIALGFDSDCHFFNDGTSLNISDLSAVPNIQAVPEPASLLLVATGLAGLRAVRRRRVARTSN